VAESLEVEQIGIHREDSLGPTFQCIHCGPPRHPFNQNLGVRK